MATAAGANRNELVMDHGNAHNPPSTKVTRREGRERGCSGRGWVDPMHMGSPIRPASTAVRFGCSGHRGSR